MELKTDNGLDIKKFREELISKRAMNERDKLEALKAKENIDRIFKTIKEEHVSLLESRGIFVRQLFNYDLDRVLIDREYNKEFLSLFNDIVKQIMNLLEEENASNF